MSKFYSKATGGFYSLDIHDKDALPADVVEIEDEEWQALLAAQSQGQTIVCGTHGLPIAVDPDPAPGLLAQRDNALRESDWLVARHRDEIELNPGQTTLTGEQYAALQSWRRDLRNIGAHPDFPKIPLPMRPV